MKTRIPKALASMKWPDSWKKMMTPRTTIRARVELAKAPIASIKRLGFQSWERLRSLVGGHEKPAVQPLVEWRAGVESPGSQGKVLHERDRRRPRRRGGASSRVVPGPRDVPVDEAHRPPDFQEFPGAR